ncbi:MAG: Ig-like domain-containing protein [Candidatus Poribacteria bacterium]|nr:Ig-like domain-containing protein [Candidatus Poribacteria bacterium]
MKGIKREGIEFRRRFFQLEIPFGAQLFVNGQQVSQLPETFDGDFEFENVELIEGRSVLQARLTILVRYTVRLCVLVGREPRRDRNGNIIRDRRGRVRYRYIYAYVSRTFEFRYRGPFSNRIVANVDGAPPLVNILGPDEEVPTRTPKLLASIQDSNLDLSSIVFDLDGRRIIPDFNPETGLAQFTPPSDNPFAVGPHKFRALADDLVGNTGGDELDFTINPLATDEKAPDWISLSPDRDTKVRTRQTGVVAGVSDTQNSLDPNSIVVEVNGQAVPHSYAAIDPQTGQISFTAIADGDGIVQLMVSIADTAGNLGTCDWSFEVDTIGPVAPTINAVDCTREDTTTVTGTTEPGASVKFILNGAFYTEVIADRVSGAYSFVDVPLVVGENTFRAIPIDSLGNVGVPSVLLPVIRDEVPPVISIFNPVENQILATLTPSVSASIADNCAVDESSISLGVRIEAANGAQLNRLSALQEGDVVPITNFDYNSNTGLLTFTLPQLLDQSIFTVMVSASDTAGNQAESAVTAQINTAIDDNRPPTIANVSLAGQSVASGDTIATGNNQPLIAASVVDAESGVDTVTVIVNGTALDTNYDEGTSTATAQPSAALPDGSYDVEIQATDNNDNIASFFFNFDVLTAVPEPGMDLEPDVERTREGTIDVIASNVLPGSIATWVVNGIPVFSRTFNPGEARFRRAVLLEVGPNEIAIDVRDAVGNAGMSPVRTVERDVIGPEIFLLNPVNGDTIPGAEDVSVNLLLKDASGIDESSIRIQIESPSGVVLTQQNRLIAQNRSLVNQGPTEFEASRTISAPEDGLYRLRAIVDDAVGNPVAQPFTASFRVDATPPEIEILVPGSDGEVVANSIPQLSGEIDPNDVLVTSIVVDLDGTVVAHLYISNSGQVIVEPRELEDGDHTLTIRATDLVGNSNSASRRFSVDTTAEDNVDPVLSGFFPSPGATISSTSLALLSFIAADAGAINQNLVFLTINGRTIQPGAGALQFNRGRVTIFLDRLFAQQVGGGFGGVFQLDPLSLGVLEDPLSLGVLERPIGIGAGLNTVSVQVSDLAGNISTFEWNFFVVLEPPEAPILDTFNPLTAEAEISISGQVPGASFGVSVTFSVNDAVVKTTAVGADGSFIAENLLLVTGENRISARAADLAGNPSARSDTQSIFLDLEEPRVVIDELPTSVGEASLTITGNATDNSDSPLQSISLILDGGDPQALGTDAAFSAEVTLQPGENAIRVEAVDAVGNTASATITVLLDSEAPLTAPADLTAFVNATGNAVQLAWEADENARTYNIYRSDTEITGVGDLQPIGTGIVDVTFVDTSIVTGLTTHYAVASVDPAGNEGEVVSNSPNVTLITNAGGTATLTDGTQIAFARDGLFRNPSLSASATINTVGDELLVELPLAISNTGREIAVTDQAGAAVESFSKNATLTLAFPESVTDSADSPRIFELIGDQWEKLENQAVDTANNTVAVQISRPGIYRLGEIQLNPWDVTQDNTVDLFDLVVVAGQFGMSPPENPAADVDGNGAVEIFDLVLVGIHFGETYGSASAAPIATSLTEAQIQIRMVASMEHAEPSSGVGPQVGDNLVTIQVHADTSTDLGGFQFDFHFDSKRLSVAAATKGGLFEAQGHQSFWLPPKAADGKLTFGSVALRSPNSSLTKDLATVLTQVTFRVKGDISAAVQSIRLENVQVADLDGRPISANWQNRIDVNPLATWKLQTVLMQNYPNPFNPETWIPYQLADDSHVVISIYNMQGEPIRAVNLGFVPAGAYISRERAFYWNGRNEQGEPVASGVYFYTIRAGEFFSTKKLVLLK